MAADVKSEEPVMGTPWSIFRGKVLASKLGRKITKEDLDGSMSLFEELMLTPGTRVPNGVLLTEVLLQARDWAAWNETELQKARRTWEQQPENRALSSEDKAAAWTRVRKQHPGAYYIALDVKNLAGANSYFGANSEADQKILRPIAYRLRLVCASISIATGGRWQDFHPTGDELAVILTKVSERQVTQTFDLLVREVSRWAEIEGYDRIPHTKLKRQKGIGLTYGIAEISPGEEPADIVRRAEQQRVEQYKRGAQLNEEMP